MSRIFLFRICKIDAEIILMQTHFLSFISLVFAYLTDNALSMNEYHFIT